MLFTCYTTVCYLCFQWYSAQLQYNLQRSRTPSIVCAYNTEEHRSSCRILVKPTFFMRSGHVVDIEAIFLLLAIVLLISLVGVRFCIAKKRPRRIRKGTISTNSGLLCNAQTNRGSRRHDRYYLTHPPQSRCSDAAQHTFLS